MHLMIGKTLVDEEGQRQLRYAIEARIAELKKLEAKNSAEHVRSDAPSQREDCQYLAALLDPETHEGEVTRRKQLDAFEVRAGEDLDSIVDDVKKEAAARKRLRIRTVLERLLAGVDPAAFVGAEDNAIAILIGDIFDDVEYVDEAEGQRWLGVIRYDEEGQDVAWLGVRGGAVPALWDGIDPSGEWLSIAPDRIGESLFEAVRSVLTVKAEQDAGEDPPLPWEDDEGAGSVPAIEEEQEPDAGSVPLEIEVEEESEVVERA